MPKNANKAKIAAKNFDRNTEFLLTKKKKKKSQSISMTLKIEISSSYD